MNAMVYYDKNNRSSKEENVMMRIITDPMRVMKRESNRMSVMNFMMIIGRRDNKKDMKCYGRYDCYGKKRR